MDLSGLRAEVARNKTVDGSVKELVSKLAGIIEDMKDDPAELEALVAELRDDNNSLADVVMANTEPAPPVEGVV